MDIEVKNTVCDFNNLHRAMKECRKGVMWKDSVSRYSNNALVSIYKLQQELLSNTYRLSPYHHFTIYEPKKREIISTRFKDRVFQRSLCDNYLYHAITKSFIYDNAACQIGKGTDFARRRLECHLQRHYRKHGLDGYILSCDLKNFFGSTPHSVAKQAIAKHVHDEWARQHVFAIIDSYSRPDSPGAGLGLGSQVTQLIQLAVLNDLDHMIKEKLHIKAYVRYMDDFLLIHNDKEYLLYCLQAIKKHLEERGLQLNQKKTQLIKLTLGIKFLGFKFTLTESGKVLKTLLKDNIKKRKRKLRKYRDLVLAGKMSFAKSRECYLAWKAYAQKGSTYHLLQRMDDYYLDLWKE